MKKIQQIVLFCILVSLFCNLQGMFYVQDEWTKFSVVHLGEVINNTITLVNDGENPVNVRVSLSDFLIEEEGSDVYLQPGTTERSNADWIQFQSNFTLQSSQTYLLPFSIHVPDNADLEGSYWSILFIEEVQEFSEENPEIININFKYAVQIINTIVNTEQSSVEVSKVTFIAPTTETEVRRDTLSFYLNNTGNHWIEANIRVDVFNENAEFVNSFVAEKIRVYPKHEREVLVPVTLRRYTLYHALIVTDTGNDNIFGHQVSFFTE